MNISPELLKRYQAGQCTPEEQQAIEQWLDEPDAPALDDIPAEAKAEIGARTWERLHMQSRRSFRGKYRHYWSGLAAMLVLAGGMAWYSMKPGNGNAARPKVAVQLIHTQKGETRKLTLPDGTIATLAYDSEIRFPSAFTDSVRRVILIGEAHFAVTKNPKQPFVVETPATQVRVLGTVFDLKEYPGESNSTLLVTEGRVRFTNKLSTGSAIVTAGKAGIATGKSVAVNAVSGNDAEVSWLNNALHFNDIALGQIAREVERKYNVNITIGADALKNERYTGTFRNASLPAVVSSLSYAIDFRYEIKGQSIHIYE